MARKKSKYYYKYKKKKSKGKTNFYNQPKTSKLEKTFENTILRPVCNKFGLTYKEQHKIKTKFYDFIIPELNLIVEVDGDYYHGKKKDKHGRLNEIQKRNMKNDQYKNKLAIKNGYNIIRFWGSDIRETKSHVAKALNDKIKRLLSKK